MAFIDEMTILAFAGNGGNGVVRWRHEKGKEFSGPSGGNGGAGGSVFATAVRDIGVLSSYRNQKEFRAEKGENGKNNSMHGKNGEDYYIKLPIGSVITIVETGKQTQLLEEGESTLLFKGGIGGYGNENFKSSTNTKPEEWTSGKSGERGTLQIELELIVDAGFIGLPNAGKSSLLNELTNAKAEVGSYAFTTLDPNLGDFYGFILADIPGLIEGASEGKGLGHKFLRHIKRTKILLHCISLEQEDVVSSYNIVRKELEVYNTDLGKKREVVILTKTDVVSPKVVENTIKQIKKVSKEVYAVSILDDTSVKEFQDSLSILLRKAK